jgi:hypothetical protein
VLLPVGGEDARAFLSCSTCLPSWEINHAPIDRPPWSMAKRKGNDRSSARGAGGPWLGGSTGRRGDRLAGQLSYVIGVQGPRLTRRDSLSAILGDSRLGYEGRPRSLRAAAFAYLHSSSASRSLFHLSSA